MCRDSRRPAATVSSCASNPPIRCSITTRRANSWKRWSPGRYPKLRIENAHQSRDRKGAILTLLLSLAVLSACRQDMHDQPKYTALRPSDFFADGRSARPISEGTVARGYLDADVLFYTGKGADGKPSNDLPM